MDINPILENLGFSSDDKVVIIHADDVGLNLSSIEAYEELINFQTISSGSVMAHTSWLPEVVKRALNNDNWDLGVHLAFNGEYETYKWRPISTMDKASGFIDEHGYMIQDKKLVQETAQPSFVNTELNAQIDLVKNLGLKITHVDTHTGTLWNKKFIDSYINVLDNHKILPVLFTPDGNEEILEAMKGDRDKLKDLQENNFPLLDGVLGLPVEHTYATEDRFNLAKQILKTVEPGKLYHFAFHPIKDSHETRALNRYTEGRIGDFKVFIKKEMKDFLKNEGIHLIGYKEVAQSLGLMK